MWFFTYMWLLSSHILIIFISLGSLLNPNSCSYAIVSFMVDSLERRGKEQTPGLLERLTRLLCYYVDHVPSNFLRNRQSLFAFIAHYTNLDCLKAGQPVPPAWTFLNLISQSASTKNSCLLSASFFARDWVHGNPLMSHTTFLLLLSTSYHKNTPIPEFGCDLDFSDYIVHGLLGLEQEEQWMFPNE